MLYLENKDFVLYVISKLLKMNFTCYLNALYILVFVPNIIFHFIMYHIHVVNRLPFSNLFNRIIHYLLLIILSKLISLDYFRFFFHYGDCNMSLAVINSAIFNYLLTSKEFLLYVPVLYSIYY